MVNSTKVFWYAIQKREYLAILGLLLQQRWFSEPIKLLARLVGYIVMALCIGLISLVTVIMARDVAPVIAQQGTWKYSALYWTIVLGSFNILFNFISAAVFSMRLGSAPPSRRPRGSTIGDFPTNTESATTSRDFSPTGIPQVEVRSSSRSRRRCQGDEESNDEGNSSTASGEFIRPPPLPERNFCSRLRMWLWGFCPLSLRRPLASDEVLQELERLSFAGEHYTAKERRHKLLDEPRRHCKTCYRLKAPREHHCSLCNECVAKMDHHCMFLNNCVDVENQRYFVLFVLWLEVMSFFVVGSAGCGWLYQTMFERQLRQLMRQLAQNMEMDSCTALQERLLHLLSDAPYGPDGVKLTSTLVNLSLMLACVTIVFTSYFNVQNFLQIRRNATPIEEINIRYKRRWVFFSTNFWYRNPYDLGPWRNFIEVFRTAGDPIVLWELERIHKMEKNREASSATLPAPRQGYLGLFLRTIQRVVVVVWLLTVPTLRPSEQDGIHYPVYDSEVRDRKRQSLTVPTESPVALL